MSCTDGKSALSLIKRGVGMSHRSRLTHAFMPKLLDRSNSSVASTSPLKKSSSGSSYATGRLHSVLYSNRSTTRPGNDLHVLPHEAGAFSYTHLLTTPFYVCM